MKRKFCTILLAIAVSANIAWAYDFYVDGIYYDIIGGEARVTYKTNWYTSSYHSSSITIPEYVKGYHVTQIGDHAFYKCSVTTIKMPKSIKKIGESAFYQCPLKSALYLPEDLEEIGKSAFFANDNGSGVDTICIHSKLRSVGEYAFANWNVSFVKYYGTVKDWCSIVYYGNYRSAPWDEHSGVFELYMNDEPLKDLVIPGDVNNNGLTYAFCGCQSIESVTIEDGVTSLKSTFERCYNLKTVTLSDNIQTLNSTFRNCLNLISANVPRYASDMPYAFWGCESLSELSVPDSLETISTSMFYKTAITSFKCSHVKTIGSSAFWDCEKLKTIEITGDLKKISDNAFEDCQSLKYIHIGENITSIGVKAFKNCTSIEYVIIDAMQRPSVSSWKKKDRIFPDSTIIYVPFEVLPSYASSNWGSYFDMRAYKEHYLINITHTPTSIEIEFGSDDDNYQIVSASIDSIFFFAGNKICHDGLDVMSRIPAMTIYIRSNHNEYFELPFESYNSYPDLTFNTYAPEMVSSDFAVLLASTNAAEYESRCGFEYGLAASGNSTRMVGCVRDSNLMRARISNLESATEYKYRPYYKSRNENITYGEWQHFVTSGEPVHYDPTLRTDTAINITENSAILFGYILSGSSDIIEQGFEYWAESRHTISDNTPRHIRTALGEHYTITAEGTTVHVMLTDLDAGTIYKYRVYAKTNEGVMCGQEKTFTTLGEYVAPQAVDNVYEEQMQCSKVISNGQLFILRGDKTYTVQGQEVR